MNVYHKMFQIVQQLQIQLYVNYIVAYGKIKHVRLVNVLILKQKSHVHILVQEQQAVNLYVYGKIIHVYLHQIRLHLHQIIVIQIPAVHTHGLVMHVQNVKENQI